MMEPITCPRCRRAFGGEQAYRKAHPVKVGDGSPHRQRCRPVKELREIGLHRNGKGVWHRSGTPRIGQTRLPLFGRGRPRIARRFFLVPVGEHTAEVRPRPHGHPIVTLRAA
jgi:hypothetical protein